MNIDVNKNLSDLSMKEMGLVFDMIKNSCNGSSPTIIFRYELDKMYIGSPNPAVNHTYIWIESGTVREFIEYFSMLHADLVSPKYLLQINRNPIL